LFDLIPRERYWLKKSNSVDELVEEPIKITLHPSINSQLGFKLSIARIKGRIIKGL
jgi:hypothetical protein